MKENEKERSPQQEIFHSRLDVAVLQDSLRYMKGVKFESSFQTTY